MVQVEEGLLVYTGADRGLVEEGLLVYTGGGPGFG